MHTWQEARKYDKNLENEVDETNQRGRYFEAYICEQKCRIGALF